MQVDVDGMLTRINGQVDPLALVNTVTANLSAQGRVLQHVVVNGQEVQTDWFSALTNATTVKTLAFQSVSITQMLQESIANLIDVLPQLAVDVKQVALYLQTGQDERAFPLITSVVEGMQSYLQLLNLVAQYVPGQSSSVENHVTPLVQWLEKAMTAWHQDDYVLMADYFGYEIEPQIQRGHRWLQNLKF